VITDPEPLSPTELRKWTIYLLILAILVAIFSFGTYAWLLYQQKITDANMDKTGSSNPDITPYHVSGTDTNKTEEPSTAPMTNSN